MNFNRIILGDTRNSPTQIESNVVMRPLLVLCLSLGSCAAHAATFHVGAKRDNTSLSSVLPRLRAGDVVEIDPGTYRETNRISAIGTLVAPIIIRGVGATQPVFDASDLNTSGAGTIPRGAFEITGAHVVLEHLEIKNARNGENAAGVRLLHSTFATIRDCHIHDCDMGVFGDDLQTAAIEHCEVDHNGSEKFAGYSHNFYMSGNAVLVRDCHIHDATWGQNFKSRAHFNELRRNWIVGSNEGEVGFVDSPGNTDRPNSGALLADNLIQSRPDRTGNGAKFVVFGTESNGKHDGTLWLWRNTFVAGTNRIQFITLSDELASAQIHRNAFIGSDQLLNLARKPASITARHNLLPQTAKVPEGWTNDWPRNPSYVDGEGVSHSLEEPEQK